MFFVEPAPVEFCRETFSNHFCPILLCFHSFCTHSFFFCHCNTEATCSDQPNEPALLTVLLSTTACGMVCTDMCDWMCCAGRKDRPQPPVNSSSHFFVTGKTMAPVGRRKSSSPSKYNTSDENGIHH